MDLGSSFGPPRVLLEEVGRPYGLPYDPIIRGDDGGQCLQVSTSPEFLKDVVDAGKTHIPPDHIGVPRRLC